MQYVIIARDKPDALDRRLAARSEHMQGIRQRKRSGEIVDGGALLDRAGNMMGSVILCEFPSRKALDDYIRAEIYKRNEVWGEIEVIPFRQVDWESLLK